MNSIIAHCKELCGIGEKIRDDVPDCTISTTSNVNLAHGDSATLVDILATADRVQVDGLDGTKPTTVDKSTTSEIEATVLPTEEAVPNDGIQQHPIEASLVTLPDAIEIPDDSIQWCPVEASTVPSGIENYYNDDIQQDPDEASSVTVPSDIEVTTDDI